MDKIGELKQKYKDFNSEAESIPISLQYLEQKLLHLTRDLGWAIELLYHEEMEKYNKELNTLTHDQITSTWKRSPENQKLIKKFYTDLFNLSNHFPKEFEYFRTKYIEYLQYYDRCVDLFRIIFAFHINQLCFYYYYL